MGKIFANELGEPIDNLKNLALNISQIHNWSSNERKLNDIENPKMGGGTKKLIKPLSKTMNENPKSHLHIF